MLIGFEDIQSFMVVLLSLFAVIATVWGGIKAIKEAMKPLSDITQRLDDDEEKLARDNRRIQDLEESNRLVLEAIDKLIGHEINDNDDTSGLEEVQTKIHAYLMGRSIV